jgi:hypothetical protein
MKRADVAVCIHVTQGECNHGGAVRARSRSLCCMSLRDKDGNASWQITPFAAQERAN